MLLSILVAEDFPWSIIALIRRILRTTALGRLQRVAWFLILSGIQSEAAYEAGSMQPNAWNRLHYLPPKRILVARMH